jgi:hypothetical protein
MGRMMINGDTVSWEGELQKKQGKLAQAVAFIKRNIPKFKVVEAIPDRAHGGIIRYTEANPSEQHDPSNEPHQISLPSSPRVKWKAWMRQQLEPALEQNAKGVGVGGQMRSRFRNQGGYKLASENKEERNWFNVLKTPLPDRYDSRDGFRYDELLPQTKKQVDEYWEKMELPEELKQERIWATTNQDKIGTGGYRLGGYDPDNPKDMKTLRNVKRRGFALEDRKGTDRVFPATRLTKDLNLIFNDRKAEDKNWVTNQVRNKVRAFDNKGYKFSSSNLAVLRRNNAEEDVIRFIQNRMTER